MSDETVNLAGIIFSEVTGSTIQTGDITTSISAGGDVVGRDKIINNITNLVERALSAVEEAEKGRSIAAQRLAEGVRAYTERIGQIVANHTDALQGEPYRGLLAYTLSDAEIFFGREQAMVELLAHLRRGRLTILHSESGSGKSSLLQAGLMYQLIVQGHLPVYIRPYDQPPALVVKRAFVPNLATLPELAGAPLRDYLHQVTAVLGQKTILVIILDQFEELFTLLDEEGRTAFVNELAECLEDESLNVRWVLALRTEFFGNLANFRPRIRNPFENDNRLNRLTPAEAEIVITEPAIRQGINFEPKLVEMLLNDLRDPDKGEVAPPQIQLVCSALYNVLLERRKDKPDVPPIITLQMYQEEGRAEGILRGHLNRVLRRTLKPQEREAARQLLIALVSSDQRRIRRTKSELAATLATYLTAAQSLDKMLEQLVENRLLNVDEDEQTGDLSYELAHDTLLAEIELDPETQARKAAQEMLLQEAETYKRFNTLLSEDKFKIINSQREFLTLNGPSEELLRLSEAAIEAEERAKEARRQRELEQAQQLAEEQQKLAEEAKARAKEQEEAATRQRKLTRIAFGIGAVAILLFIAAAFLGVQSRQNANNANNAKATAQAQRDAVEAELNFYQISDPAARLAELSRLFSRPEPESQARGRGLFFGLRSPDQFALLGVTDKPEELATVSRAILPNLADINGTYVTNAHLTTMQESLADPDLQAEIESWLAAREAAQAGEYDAAVAKYTELLEMDDQNPAFWFERGNVQPQVVDSLADFSEVMALAQAPEYQPSGTSSAEWNFTNTKQMEEAVARMLMVYPTLAAEVEANKDNYPNLSDITLPTYVTDDMGVEMVLIPAGSFNMGSDSLSARADEVPVHEVELDEFYIDQYEVTNAWFVDFLNDQGNQEEGGIPWLSEEWSYISAAGEGWQIETGYDDYPVTGVSWYGASAYCNWRGGQLPTEAQWEKAARGDDERTYPWGEELHFYLANYYRDDTSDITPAGAYPTGVSPYGAYDMAGNVSEWVADAYDSEYYARSPDLNPAGPEDDQNISDKVVRGGSWSGDWLNMRTSVRNFATPDSQGLDIGFRCAQSAP